MATVRLPFYYLAFLLLVSFSPKTVYNSIEPNSLAQYLAFYELYPETPEGKKALKQAWRLLSGENQELPNKSLSQLPTSEAVKAIVSLVNKEANKSLPDLSETDLQVIKQLGSRLANRRLQGFFAKSEDEVLSLPTTEVDLSRGLFLSQVAQGQMTLKQLHTYEAILDLMALQIQAQLPLQVTPEEKIRVINQFIFQEMGFRFPPHSSYTKDVDLFTLLPSVIDSRRGVCLGVSILYYSLAQRLNLPLEAITPPGHIYLRYLSNEGEINIETTARGVHLDSETYLGINTKALQKRTCKEMIGLSHFNQASAYWTAKKIDEAISSYQIAKKYLPEDPLLKELLGFNYLLKKEVTVGKQLLKESQETQDEYTIFGELLAKDFLEGKTDIEGIEVVVMSVDENRESLLKKREALEKKLEQYPQFRSALFHLAVTFIQLHRNGEGLEILKKYDALVPDDPTAKYYLAILYLERRNYNQAWKHLHQAEKLVYNHAHFPKALKTLRNELKFCCPE